MPAPAKKITCAKNANIESVFKNTEGNVLAVCEAISSYIVK